MPGKSENGEDGKRAPFLGRSTDAHSGSPGPRSHHVVPGARPHTGIQHAQGKSIKNRHKIHLNHISDF